ncbi:MAG: hypothetical protein AB7F32_02750 [Victivallaceae bacterium]
MQRFKRQGAAGFLPDIVIFLGSDQKGLRFSRRNGVVGRGKRKTGEHGKPQKYGFFPHKKSLLKGVEKNARDAWRTPRAVCRLINA